MTISSNDTELSPLFAPSGHPDQDVVEDLSPAWRVEVQSKSGQVGYACGPGESLLYAGLRHGVGLPYECATGTCGSCRARVVSGEVEVGWDAAPGHANLKREKGDILMCQTRPHSDCVVRVPANVQMGFSRHVVPDHRSGIIDVVRQLTPDVMHFEITLKAPISFDAGQFVILRVPGLEGMRAYSMVNYSTETRRLEFVIKRKQGGGFSNWMFNGMPKGQTVALFGPLGQATFHPYEGHNVLMVAGGSGIAGMMSILSRATQENYFADKKGYVFFGVRTLADCFYLSEFSRNLSMAHGNLSITLAISDEEVRSPDHPGHPGIQVEGGMVHEVCARAMKGRYDNLMSFIAGPPPMVEGALRTLIIEGKMTPDRIRYDKFG